MQRRQSSIIYTVSFIIVALLAGFLVYRNFSDKHTTFNIDSLKESTNIIPVAIIGSGPAGLSAALYGARGKCYTVVFEGKQPGGQLTGTSWVENWPGVPKVLGKDVIDTLRKQAQSFGAVTLSETITSVDFATWPFVLTTEDGDTVSALTVIIATGANPRLLNVPGELENWGKGVTTCAICDAPFYKGNDVVVVGGGDSAVEEALQLAPYAKTIKILVRGTSMRASATMQEHIKENPQISVMYQTSIKAIKADEHHVNAIDIITNGKTETMPIDGVFLAIGHEPNTQLYKQYLSLDEQGYIVLNNRTQSTSIPGIYVAGDVADRRYRQAGVAAGDGIKAALDALEFLREHGYNDTLAQELESKRFTPVKNNKIELQHIDNKQEYEQHVLKSEIPVVLDFYTEFCPSCLSMMPTVEIVAAELQDKVTFYKVNALEYKELAEELMVPTVPTLLVFDQGKLVARSKDIMNKQQLTEFVSRFIK